MRAGLRFGPGIRPRIAVSQDPLWYKDAVFYELHVKACHDSNGNGIGDFNGSSAGQAEQQERGPENLVTSPTPSPSHEYHT